MNKIQMERYGRIVLALSRGYSGPLSVEYVAGQLVRLEKQLQRIAEKQCSVEMSENEERALERREERIEARARKLVESLGYRYYRQGDPRGCQIYAIRPGDLPAGEPGVYSIDSWYTCGVACCVD